MAIESLVAKSVFEGYGVQVYKGIYPYGGFYMELTEFDRNGKLNRSLHNRIENYPEQFLDLWFNIESVLFRPVYDGFSVPLGDVDATHGSDVGMIYDPLPKDL